MDLLTYEADLPAVKGDTQSYEFIVTANDAEQPLVAIAKDVATTPQFEVPEDATVLLKLFPIDNKGNRGPASEQTFTAADTIPPEAPGAFGEVRLVSERVVPDA